MKKLIYIVQKVSESRTSVGDTDENSTVPIKAFNQKSDAEALIDSLESSDPEFLAISAAEDEGTEGDKPRIYFRIDELELV